MTKNFPYLTHPFVLFALLLTFVNDQFLKEYFANFLTGKISDFTGLFFFPLFLCAILEFFKSPGAFHTHLIKKNLIAAVVLTDLAFVILKFSFLREVFVETFSRYAFAIQIVPDLTDLAALIMNGVTYRFARRFF